MRYNLNIANSFCKQAIQFEMNLQRNKNSERSVENLSACQYLSICPKHALNFELRVVYLYSVRQTSDDGQKRSKNTIQEVWRYPIA